MSDTTSTLVGPDNAYYHRQGGAGGSTSSNNDMSEHGDLGWTSEGGCTQLFRRIASTGSVTLRPGSTTPRHGASAASIADVIETDYLRRWNSRDESQSHHEDDTGSSGRSDLRSKGFPTDSEPNLTYGTFSGATEAVTEEQIDADSCRRLCLIISRCLNEAAPIMHGDRAHRLVGEEELIKRIAADVVRMSQNEPLGTNGCLLRINLEGVGGGSGSEGGVGFIAAVRCREEGEKVTSMDSATPPATCEVILSLREDDKRWHGLSDAVSRVICCRGLVQNQKMYISPAYKLEKIKLYLTTRSH